MIVNRNSFDPSLGDLKAELNDSWRDMRQFLGLSSECEFPDKFIPKGWRPSSGDEDDTRSIARVTGDGYYYYKDGTQRRGKRHYAANKYLCIMCDPSNFEKFRKKWDDVRLLTGSPTWREYSFWGMYPDLWDEKGVNVSAFRAIKNVKWRKGK